MGLTNTSTGKNVLSEDILEIGKDCDFSVAIAGNPNVGKSTIFNALTGMHQHTGNWPGKTVANAAGVCKYKDKKMLLVDIPGTYSIMSNSEEEEIARDYICFGRPDATVVILDATSLERNLNLVYQIMEITNKVIVCVNLLDEAKKKGIHIDFIELEKRLGVPVVGTIARKKKTLNNLVEKIFKVCSEEIKPMPKLVRYSPCIEESVEKLDEILQEMLLDEYKPLSRWISLKIIDGDDKILAKIEKNFKINILEKFRLIEKKTNVEAEKKKIGEIIENNEGELENKIIETKKEIKDILGFNGIEQEDVKNKMISSIIFSAENVYKDVVTLDSEKNNSRNRKIDKILTSKKFGIPIMLAFLGLIFWITIIGANYPSEWLSQFFSWIQIKIEYLFTIFNAPIWLRGVLIDGVYKTLTWIIAVMLPPMAIFFPIFTLLEDLGYLPRIAFNLDKFFRKAGSSGKQALTMCMGFGCNSAGVTGCRIIDSPREKLISILTNAFVPCNGRFPFLITVATIFIGGLTTGGSSSLLATLTVLFVVLLGIFMTLLISKILSKTILKGESSSFILELPPYRKPQIGQVIVRSIFDRTLFVLGRAVAVAAPAGLVIWLFANINIGDISILTHIANFFEPFAKLMGLDGYILTAFILGIPANEIVLPIILMCYMGSGTLVDMENTMTIGQILIQNGWTIITAINVMIFTLLHFPCTTTLLTIKKETGSWKWTGLGFLLPTICGVVICMITTGIWNLVINFLV